MSIIVDSPLKDLELCSIVLNCEPILNPILNWNITLPNVPKPPVVPPAQPKVNYAKKRILNINIFDNLAIKSKSRMLLNLEFFTYPICISISNISLVQLALVANRCAAETRVLWRTRKRR